ncbi:MAG: cytochrome bc complex cytochrome b subunit [Candidatus Aminicenantes bacterium]|nr:cytochrome bc complex cytochrome b subunit [Candidatus Aminicenantes bacterium]MDH5385323.1 cytochrome bc complex cytochrome b subunit [Candidatus Aminicenantes bacterium]MDH5745104.1 cytochrome bc complex cytochrome b subunit [Candidatus Aminicenantes bacterium]
MKNLFQKLFAYFDSRLMLSTIGELAKKKTIPEHKHSFWYYFGGICLFLFIIQVITGILLLLYYKPTMDSAYESIQFIMSQVKFGWLIRSVHSWTANILIGAIFIHMFSAFFMKAYRPPRDLTWITGFFLLLLFMFFGFSGYLLPWNELSFFATRVGTDIAGTLPLIGKALKSFILGGPDVSGATITRFFWLHIAILPFFTLLFLGLHILLVQILGMSKPIGFPKAKVKEVPFFPNFILKDALGWMLILTLVGILCVFFPWELGKKADIFATTPLGIKPEWYFTFMFTTLKLVPAHFLFIEGELLAIFGFLIGGLIWLLVPYLDRKAAMEQKSPGFSLLGLIVLLYIIIMTALTYFHPNL